MKKLKNLVVAGLVGVLAVAPTLTGCGGTTNYVDYTDVTVTNKTISKDEYWNKTLGGLLGQFAGFLSGYEFSSVSYGVFSAVPESYYTNPYNVEGFYGEHAGFLNGPYAGNFTHYQPSATYRYDRHQTIPKAILDKDKNANQPLASNVKEVVWSDDDYHIDIFNQSILQELGSSSYAIKETWKKYVVNDWGGGMDAMFLINSADMLAPFSGSIEGGNKFGWCTEAYIENETLGMNAPGMPNVATQLIDKFATNVGYYDSVVWAKYYAALYSLAYFETDIKVVMEKALATMPENSWPRKSYDLAVQAYENNPTDYRAGAEEFEVTRRLLYRLDNRQTDPSINGGFAIMSFLYGQNSYLDTCKYASLLGYDGDCTAAIVAGVMGVLKGFKQGNEEYEALNNALWYDGEGVYYNDRGVYEDGSGKAFEARIRGDNYFDYIKISDIVDMYRDNFETILVANGGTITADSYIIPTTPVYADHSFLFENYDAEERTESGFVSKNGTFFNNVDANGTETGEVHSGFASFNLVNKASGEVYHTFKNLTKGKHYRLTVYAKTSQGGQVSIFARSGKKSEQSITFANTTTLTNKEFIFTAGADKVDVGFRFDASAENGDVLTFDDFMLEEIQREELAVVADQSMKLAKKQYMKMIGKPADVAIGEEVILCVEYRNYAKSAMTVRVNRNNEIFGGIKISPTSVKSTSGRAYVEIPYVFESENDTVQLTFDGTIYVGDITIYRQTQYMFR